MAAGEPSTAAGVGEAFWTSPVEAESTYVKRITLRHHWDTERGQGARRGGVPRGGAMAGGLELAVMAS